MIRSWRFDTPAQTLVLISENGRLPHVDYWSAPLDPDEDLASLATDMVPSPGGGVLDKVWPLSVCPQDIDGFRGVQGLEIRGADGAIRVPRLRYAAEEETARGRVIDFFDPDTGIRYLLAIDVFAESDVLSLAATVRQEGEAPGHILWLSAPVIQTAPLVEEVIEFPGRWCGEFQVNHSPLQPGIRARENRLGRSAHEHFPGLLFPTRGATEIGGEAFGLTLGQSCGHRHVIETLPDGRTQVQMGPVPGQSSREGATSGPLYLTRSDRGLNGVSQSFHHFLRSHALKYSDPARPRPVHYNCWEAVYFDHDFETLSKLADMAADLGVERFVLDDGWFGKRDDDTSSLGDWTVDLRKWPKGLEPLVDHVHACGMTFGLWFEPEMINTDSDLARAHPDWLLGSKDQVTGRHQYVLDLANPDAADHIFRAIDAILSEYAIDYIKWDHNRILPFPDPRQAEALHALLASLRGAHPGVEIETCSSGGGRIDFGILHHTQRVWLSDSNDAAERWKIQRVASYFLPPEIQGSHIGPRVCHTSGRNLPMGFRAAVAGSRAMGLEMDLRELTPEEAARVKAEVAAFKDRRALIHTGRLHRLESADPDISAEMHVAENGAGFLVLAAQTQPSRQTLPRPLPLAGLDPAARYQVRLENTQDIPPNLNRGTLCPLHRGESIEVSGQVLMQAGLTLPMAFPDTIWTVTGDRL